MADPLGRGDISIEVQSLSDFEHSPSTRTPGIEGVHVSLTQFQVPAGENDAGPLEIGHNCKAALIVASWKGDTEKVRNLLQTGADIFTVTRDGFTCLHMAALCGHTEVVNLLLHGKSPRKCLDEWPHHQALPFLEWEHRMALMDRKSSSEKFTALHLAACGDHDQGVAISASILEAYRSAALHMNGVGLNPKVAYQIDSHLWLDYLLQIRNEIHNLNLLEDPAILPEKFLKNLASRYGNYGSQSELQDLLGSHKYKGLVRSFVKLILYSNARDGRGRTALHYAACPKNKKAELVKFLIWDTQLIVGQHDSQLGSVIHVNASDVNGYTPLHFASRNGCKDVVIAILRAEVSRDLKFELSPRQNRLIKKIYLQPNAAAKPTDLSADTYLPDHQLGCACVRSERLPRPDLKSFVWVEDREGITPLHYAVEKGHYDIVELLIDHPMIDLFQRASDGKSPWIIAFPSNGKPSRSSATHIQRLLRSGSIQSYDRNLFNSTEKSYRQKLVEQAAKLAVDAKGDLDSRENDELLVLEMQILLAFIEDIVEGRKENLRSILDKTHEGTRSNSQDGSSETIFDSNGILAKDSDSLERFTLLHVAAYEGYVPELETLLSVKRYTECINDRENLTFAGYTSLQFAILRCTVDNGALAVLLKNKTLRPTKVNKKGQTPLDTLAYLVSNSISKSKLPEIRQKMTVLDKVLYYYGHPTSIFGFMLSSKKLSSSSSVMLEKMTYIGPGTDKKGEMASQIPGLALERLLDARLMLIRRHEVKLYVEHLFKDRDVHANAANAVLVGAALLATISYQGWDQQPGRTSGRGAFAIINSIALSTAILAVFTAATAVLPSNLAYPIPRPKDVFFIRMWLFRSAYCLYLSVYFIMCSYCIALLSQSRLVFGIGYVGWSFVTWTSLFFVLRARGLIRARYNMS